MAREIVTKSKRFYAVSLKPDICKTPMGNSTPPVPYTIKGEFAQAQNVSPNITSHGDKLVLHDRSTIPTVTRDGPGSATGIKSGTLGQAKGIASRAIDKVTGGKIGGGCDRKDIQKQLDEKFKAPDDALLRGVKDVRKVTDQIKGAVNPTVPKGDM